MGLRARLHGRQALQALRPRQRHEGCLPGDSTPPSRFVRAAYLERYADKPANSAAACNLSFHILDSVEIPMGTSRSRDELVGQEKLDYTQWIVVKDLGQKVLSTRFYGNMLVYSVNLSTLDFSTAAGKQFPVPTSPTSIDLTPQMNG